MRNGALVGSVIKKSKQYHQLLVTGYGYLLAIIRPKHGSTNIQEIIECVQRVAQQL